MGAWETGPFDNDEAMDFLGDIAGNDPERLRELIGNALIAVIDPDARKVPEVAAPEPKPKRWGRRSAPVAGPGDQYMAPELEVGVAVAAAALVACRIGGPPADSVVAEWLDGNPFEVDTELRQLAAAALRRAFEPTEDNDWYAAWDEAAALGDVRAALAPYRAALE